jgi:hypothetical protein|nr:MAG TPA: hypothetical protein [Caudoviricetes sp.]
MLTVFLTVLAAAGDIAGIVNATAFVISLIKK